MSDLKIISNPAVAKVIQEYPDFVRDQLLHLREIILETARGINSIKELEETLKWGEPSYLAKKGSTIRMDWKAKKPDQYAIYFKCTSKLVPTFKECYSDQFNYEGNRALVFRLDEAIPEQPLKECIRMALTYHQIKHLPLLGAKAGVVDLP